MSAVDESGTAYWPQIGFLCESVVVDYRGAHSDLFRGSRLYPRNGEQFDGNTTRNDSANSVEQSNKVRRVDEPDTLVAQREQSFADRREHLTQRFICAVPETWTQLEPVRRVLFEQEAETIELACAVAAAYRAKPTHIFPPKHLVFRALQLVSPTDVRVVIVGQDPYMFDGQADGLAFSVPDGRQPPPSLRNILREMGAAPESLEQCSGDLTTLACRGVLLLNSALTVERGKPGSHRKPIVDWERFTDAIVTAVSLGERPVCFMLWGNAAQRKSVLIANDDRRHLVLCASHPSPKSADLGFIGCGHFRQCDEWLAACGGGDGALIFQPWLAERRLLANK